MLEFKKSDCSCMICGNKNTESGIEVMNIVRDRGDNIISFPSVKSAALK